VILVHLFPTIVTILFMLAASAMSAELFRYRGAARDGGTLQYVFESDEQDVPKAVTKEQHILWHPGRRTGDPRVSDGSGAVLAGRIFRLPGKNYERLWTPETFGATVENFLSRQTILSAGAAVKLSRAFNGLSK